LESYKVGRLKKWQVEGAKPPLQGVLKCPDYGLLTPGTSVLLPVPGYLIVGLLCSLAR
jgi:hypothetical protein